LSVSFEFKNIDTKIAEYFVAIDGASPISVGPGHVGRARAYDALSKFRLSKEARKKWEDVLDALRAKCAEKARLSIAEFEGSDFFEAIVDDELVYEGKDIDDLANALNQTAKPSTGPRKPGF
jgi:hypothetical protein